MIPAFHTDLVYQQGPTTLSTALALKRQRKFHFGDILGAFLDSHEGA